MTQEEKAQRFRELHHGPPILVLPNAWDVATAKVFESAGFPAIATTSAGVAFSLGYADGERISQDEMLGVVARIARAVSVPVTADVESGYGDPVATAKAVVAAGAIGMNLEDVRGEDAETLADLDAQCRIIREIAALHLPLVINARTDIFLAQVGDPTTRLERTIKRLNAFREAGADSLFAPGVRDRETIAALARGVRGPLNILATPGTPSIADLQALGVARVSTGSGLSRAALALVRRMANDLSQGSYDSMFADQIPYAEVNRMLG
ncbi:MAG TPA: isocitrate lyase/phosphoenolpyruvate mutase family protein [Bryobacteraceae bacterium]|nr:isocitrate lyase/phosphoenolpyruvate mutase family protein [Bryobacteraceae bacterium]